MSWDYNIIKKTKKEKLTFERIFVLSVQGMTSQKCTLINDATIYQIIFLFFS